MTNPDSLLLGQLSRYLESWPAESTTTNDFLAFVRSHDDAFLRTCEPGHVTGSAFVVDPTMTMTLLVHHRKLDKWLQPGGHCEPGETALQAAIREAYEETGVRATPACPDGIFDIDIHAIPGRTDVPAHLHYDARFLLIAEPGGTTVSSESHAVAWVSMHEALAKNPEVSIVRMIAKAGTFPVTSLNGIDSPNAPAAG